MAENKVTIKIEGDDSALQKALKEITQLLELNLEVDGLRDFVQQFLDGLESRGDLVTVKHLRTEGASAIYSFEPSERFLDLLTAVRARCGVQSVAHSDLQGA